MAINQHDLTIIDLKHITKDFLTSGYFHLSIKGGYINDIFIPEMVMRNAKIQHGDFCELYGEPTDLSIVIKDRQSVLRPSKFKDIRDCVVERTPDGLLTSVKTLHGQTIKELLGIDEISILNNLPFRVTTDDLIDIRYSTLDAVPRPHVTWVYRGRYADTKNLGNESEVM